MKIYKGLVVALTTLTILTCASVAEARYYYRGYYHGAYNHYHGGSYRYYRNGVYYHNYYNNGAYYHACKRVPGFWLNGRWHSTTMICN